MSCLASSKRTSRNSCFTHENLCFSRVGLVYQRVSIINTGLYTMGFLDNQWRDLTCGMLCGCRISQPSAVSFMDYRWSISEILKGFEFSWDLLDWNCWTFGKSCASWQMVYRFVLPLFSVFGSLQQLPTGAGFLSSTVSLQ